MADAKEKLMSYIKHEQLDTNVKKGTLILPLMLKTHFRPRYRRVVYIVGHIRVDAQLANSLWAKKPCADVQSKKDLNSRFEYILSSSLYSTLITLSLRSLMISHHAVFDADMNQLMEFVKGPIAHADVIVEKRLGMIFAAICFSTPLRLWS